MSYWFLTCSVENLSAGENHYVQRETSSCALAVRHPARV